MNHNEIYIVGSTSLKSEVLSSLKSLQRTLHHEPSEEEIDQQKHTLQLGNVAANIFGHVAQSIDELFTEDVHDNVLKGADSIINFSFLCLTEEVTDQDYTGDLNFHHEEWRWYIKMSKPYQQNTTFSIIKIKKDLSDTRSISVLAADIYPMTYEEVEGKKIYFFASLPAKEIIRISKYLPRFLEAFTEGIKKRRELYL